MPEYVPPTPDAGDLNRLGPDHRHAILVGADFTGANLDGADFTGADLSYANLAGASIRGADLRGATLTGADLTGAHLDRTDLRRVDLTGAVLIDATAISARLTGGDLTDADLTGADLRGADLSRADLTGANLTGAALDQVLIAGAEMTNLNWHQARGAAIAVFHARNIAHQMTGRSLEQVADDIGIDVYAQQIEPAVEHVRAAGIDITAPGTSATPPPISWA